MNDDVVIEVRGAIKAFEGGVIKALDGADLVVRRGEFVAIVGPSGCGKSTLLHLIGALDRVDQGTVVVNGKDLAHTRHLDDVRAHDIGLIFQLHNLLPTLSALENVEVPMFELKLSSKQRRERAMLILALVGLEGREKQRPPELSGGERQRVAIARALANEAPILLADEPTGSLDSKAGAKILELLHQLQRERDITIVMVTHDMSVAAHADRIVRMLDGRVVGEERTARQPTPDKNALTG